MIENPRLLDSEVIDKVSYSLSLGCSLTTAASYSGISISTLRRYLWEYRKGNENPDIQALGKAVEAARAQFEQSAIEGVRRLTEAKEDWKGYSFLLTKRSNAFKQDEDLIQQAIWSNFQNFFSFLAGKLDKQSCENIKALAYEYMIEHGGNLDV